ncbi:DNA repair protein RecN [Myroides profundi]|uniref:DNA repair protein RecN n=1 Tax=Myroides profundi TaxID=480520 RepID=A0AAJ4W695_MYRPR|nr:DNA repair protein RecN [Myroides profundi]AJH16077.1 DNA repair protein RecN (Recombination protein N) [Myroides profundi]SER41043.1 DNA replication and repair protein RecN [Myroides profundi]
MLISLTIKNFALIDTLEIDFSNGFSIITGETGAGKSIVLGALGLLQGKRADLSSLKDKEVKCVIEGHFSIGKYGLKDLFSVLELEYEDITIIRREISPSGKSRAFVNDSPVNLSDLQRLTENLIDIHSQHQTMELSDENYQMQIVDAVANNSVILEEYKGHLVLYKKAQTQLKSLQQQQADLIKEQDYNAFLLEELMQGNLDGLNQQELEQEYEKLNNVEFVRESFGQSINLLTDDEVGAVYRLKEVKQLLQKTSTISKDYEELYTRISSVEIELKDLSDEIERQLDNVSVDPEQLDLINDRLQLLYNLQRKHQVATVEELLAIRSELEEKVDLASGIDDKISSLEREIDKLSVVLHEVGDKLSESRIKAVPVLVKQLLEILSLVGIPNANFKFDFTVSKNFLANGKDELQLLFSANKGMDFGVLKKVASGGELSRIMLAIKAILARYSNLPTIIFDEIDTGVSGEVADKMGVIMKDMSNHMQVFAITHLPQIAAKGKQHYKVYKTSDDETTTSQLTLLDYESRVKEIAQMLSGKDISDSALVHAKELLSK